MALTTCPKCGGKVSDTAEVCVHCGCMLKGADCSVPESDSVFIADAAEEAGVAAKNSDRFEQYTSLSFVQQNGLRSEFENLYPKYAKYSVSNPLLKKYDLIHGITFALFLLCLIVSLLIRNDNYVLSEVIAAFGIVFVALSVFGLFFKIYFVNKILKRYFFSLKAYAVWLENVKNVCYKPDMSGFRKKWVRYYENLDTERDKF